MASTVEVCENYDNIADAVRDAVAMWPEGDTNPRPMVLNDEHGAAAVTFVPLGTECDSVLVVYNVMGLVKRYDNIRYNQDPNTGKIVSTRFKCDGVEEVIEHTF
jgi:hypothetical protein